MKHWYNEIDLYAAQWLRNLIDDGQLPRGDVDVRSIVEVTPGDVAGYTQCHFFAGIGGWPLALKLAGWPEKRPIWTGSCPCQPFSHAGEGKGVDDERHLWPHFGRLIGECLPADVLGEQVASKAVDDWIDLVFDDLERMGYACGAIAFPSASVGAPHIRDRTYWLGHADDEGLEGFRGGHSTTQGQRQAAVRSATTASSLVRLAYTNGDGFDERVTGNAGGEESTRREHRNIDDRRGVAASEGASPVNGFWRDADWLFGRDEKWRPVEPGTFPLVDGFPGRMEQLRAYGNAVNVEQATQFVKAMMECMP